LSLLTHLWFIGAVIQMSFDQIFLDRKMLDHLASSVYKEYYKLLLIN
jgi:hypothetical protein